jgi:YHS domain-containing protein
VGDAGLGHLRNLSELEYLNLYGTGITDAGLEMLGGLPKLTRLYLWQTAVSTNAAAEWAKAKTDEAQIAHLKEEIQKLQQELSAQRVIVDLGTQSLATNRPLALNATCPVSGKPVSPGITLTHEGTPVAFCCEDCRAKFKAEPKTYLARLTPQSSSTNAVSKRQ